MNPTKAQLHPNNWVDLSLRHEEADELQSHPSALNFVIYPLLISADSTGTATQNAIRKEVRL
ncbi:hypothetical protein S7335_119 [Synechococcus sp. PCC 7335]|nr:hypothetical protein S7335_119 [Synechococcus sp. PCC 7335]